MTSPAPSNSAPAGELASPDEDLEVSGPRHSVVVFRVADIWLGLDAAQVEEIVVPTPPVALPRSPEYLRGLLFVRGGGVPVLALDLFLGIAETEDLVDEQTSPARVVIVEAENMRVGIESSQVQGILEISPEELWPADGSSSQLKPYASGQIDGAQGPVTVLDLARLLHDARPRRIARGDGG